MKKLITKTSLGLLSIIVLSGLFFGVARADTTNTVLSGLITPPSQEATTTMEQRLAARRPKVQLSAADKANIAAKCSLAQSAVNDRRTKDVKAAAIRLQTYNELVKRLTFLVDNLSAQGDDATALLAAQNYFVASINNYLVDADNYKTAMDDLVNVDCKSDAAGFRATLVEARDLRTKTGQDAAAVKGNLTTLQKDLAAARQALINGKKK
jgi:molybdopterin converting factor small subunit